MSVGKTLTIPRHLYERAQRVAQKQQRDVAEIVAEVLAQGLSTMEAQTEDPEREREKEAFRHLHPMLWQKYPREYVAIYGGALVDHDADRVALLERINRKYPDVFVLIRQVRQEPEIVYEHRSVRWA
ncbi:MAG: DUF5678 domain-containing protein [Chloroflexi bacterium]|nr:DUF5678 domain-containing protein [Chloroflexota bacterium]MCI0649669.1 DUF5678 domain-containing protein [Chloroflexota bacterium]MCI0731225.1 DUF5678 domain-containing protein [Chloroflexota bacterium]